MRKSHSQASVMQFRFGEVNASVVALPRGQHLAMFVLPLPMAHQILDQDS